MAGAFLLFPNQLFKAVHSLSKDTVFYMLEDSHYFTRLPFHTHKLILQRAGMQVLREQLLIKGYTVHYFAAEQGGSLSQVEKELVKNDVQELNYYDVVDHTIELALRSLAQRSKISLKKHASPSFLLSHASTSQVSKVLKSEYDLEKVPKVPVPKDILVFEHDRYIEEAIAYVRKNFPKNPGIPEEFAYPVTHNDAEEALEYGENIMPLLNVGLLVPKQVIKKLHQGVARASKVVSVLVKREKARLLYEKIADQPVKKSEVPINKKASTYTIQDLEEKRPLSWYLVYCIDAYAWWCTVLK